MFFKQFKKYASIFLLSYFLIPIHTLAYSKYIIPGGESVGIKIQTDGVLIVGTYKVNSRDLAAESGLKKGDYIISLNDRYISSIDELINIINENKGNNLKISYKRNDKVYQTNLNVIFDNGIYKTGLYVKDSITGIGTVSYYDPETKIYGALGHEIMEKNTGDILEAKSGKIFKSNITNIDRSEIGNPGSKNAEFYSNEVLGTISKNTKNGIFGKYNDNLDNSNIYEVADIEDIKLDKAYLRTVVDGNTVKNYEIKILRVNKDKNTNKNILFEIIDEELLSKTGGVVQGMSGSTIIQGNYIIGAVNYVLVDEPTKGYGIFIKNMLEESEK